MDVVVAACNEEDVLGPCLVGVLRQAVPELRVVVVANGCRDGTVDVARGLASQAIERGHELRLLVLEEASKTAALNAATPHLREGAVVYLDADVVLGPGALCELDDVLRSHDTPVLAAPRRVTLTPRDRVCASAHLVREQLPRMRSGVVGGGCYAMNPAGRRRFREFPSVIADDAYVRSLFAASEQVVLDRGVFLCRMPESRRELVGLLRRWRSGNRQVRARAGSQRPGLRRHVSSVEALVSRPRSWRHLPAYSLLSLASAVPPGRAEVWARAQSSRSRARPGTLPALRPRVQVIVVTYRSRADIDACLASLDSAVAELTITVVDNASDDGTASYVEFEYGSVEIVRNIFNVGFGAAVNQVAALDDHDYVLLLNPDTVLAPDCVDHLLALALCLPDAGMYGGRALGPDGRLDPSSCLALPALRHAGAFFLGASHTRWAWLDPDDLARWDRQDAREVPALAGALLLLEARIWQEVGPFDGDYFLYGEDVDLAVRARAVGARPAFTPLAEYRHARGSSSASDDQVVALLAGKMTLAHKHLSPARVATARRLYRSGVLLRALLLSEPGRARWLAAWLRRDEWSHGWPAARERPTDDLRPTWPPERRGDDRSTQSRGGVN